jgi:hypothetical protein
MPVAFGTRARQTVERSFSWERYTDALWRVLSGALFTFSGIPIADLMPSLSTTCIRRR